MPTIRFWGFHVDTPDGWEDVTDTVGVDGAPATIARPDGVGALQFSVGLYTGGTRPDPSVELLLEMLHEFGEARGLGAPGDVVMQVGRLRLVAGLFLPGNDFLRVWYLSDGLSFALVTYVCEAGREAHELADCERIVRSLTFDAPGQTP